MDPKSIGLCPQGFESRRCRSSRAESPKQKTRNPKRTHVQKRCCAHGVMVSHPLGMRKALGSSASVSMSQPARTADNPRTGITRTPTAGHRTTTTSLRALRSAGWPRRARHKRQQATPPCSQKTQHRSVIILQNFTNSRLTSWCNG